MVSQESRFSRIEGRPGTFSAGAVLALFSLGVSLLLQSCAAVGVGSTDPGPTTPPIPSIGEQSLSRTQERRGRDILRAARDSAGTAAWEFVRANARTLIREYPGLPGSAEAYGLLAQAEFQERHFPGAAEAAREYRVLLGQGHPYFPSVALLESRAWHEAGETEGVLSPLLQLPSDTDPELQAEARELARGALPSLPMDRLEGWAREVAGSHPLRGLLTSEWASRLYLQGEEAEARRWAAAALDGPLEGRERALADGVMEGRLEEVLELPVVIGVVLPRSQVSPNTLQYAEWIQEGVQVALAEFQPRLRRPVQLEVVDDRGVASGARRAMRILGSAGAVGALGFLSPEVLGEAAEARPGGFPLISPVSFLSPEEAPGVYSLSGPDPGGARALAQAARELELVTVAIVRPATEEARVDAEAFQEEFQARGGRVPSDIVYEPGSTFFQPQFQEVEGILPDGLFLPLTPRDIQLLAPQITFYGIDTLGAQILGTSGWTEDAVVMEVDSRHTDGVVAATTRTTQDQTESFLRFQEAYESFFQKTLRSQVPAFGYDAAALILKAMEAGPRDPQELGTALGEIRDFPGATGVLSVEEGRILRRPLLVRIQDHELIYITRRFR